MSSSLNYARNSLRCCVAKIAIQIGWVSSHDSCLELLADILEKRLLETCVLMHKYAEHFGRREVFFGDLELTFQDMCITESELRQFAEALVKGSQDNSTTDVCQFPYSRPDDLRIPKLGRKNLPERPEYVDDYFPLFNQETMDVDRTSSESTPQNQQDSPSKRGTAGNKALPDEAGHSQYVPRSVVLRNGVVCAPTVAGVRPEAKTPPPINHSVPSKFFLQKPQAIPPPASVVVRHENEDIDVDVVDPKPVANTKGTGDPDFRPAPPAAAPSTKKVAKKPAKAVDDSSDKRKEKEAKKRRLENYGEFIDKVIHRLLKEYAAEKKEKMERELEEAFETVDKELKAKRKAAKKAAKEALQQEQLLQQQQLEQQLKEQQLKQEQLEQQLKEQLLQEELQKQSQEEPMIEARSPSLPPEIPAPLSAAPPSPIFPSALAPLDTSPPFTTPLVTEEKKKKKKKKDKDKKKDKEKKEKKKEKKEKERMEKETLEDSSPARPKLKFKFGGPQTSTPPVEDSGHSLPKLVIKNSSPEKEISPAPPPVKVDSPPSVAPVLSVPSPPKSKVKTLAQKKEASSMRVLAETMSSTVTTEGERVWICPVCNLPDDGSPMIGCDNCDDWCHWICVGIKEEPPENMKWFCPNCRLKGNKPGKKKAGRKPKKKSL